MTAGEGQLCPSLGVARHPLQASLLITADSSGLCSTLSQAGRNSRLVLSLSLSLSLSLAGDALWYLLFDVVVLPLRTLQKYRDKSSVGLPFPELLCFSLCHKESPAPTSLLLFASLARLRQATSPRPCWLAGCHAGGLDSPAHGTLRRVGGPSQRAQPAYQTRSSSSPPPSSETSLGSMSLLLLRWSPPIRGGQRRRRRRRRRLRLRRLRRLPRPRLLPLLHLLLGGTASRTPNPSPTS
ncbi:hypothetical protein VTK73DRAFT_5291 [Phialemonium thermophilum]|uniref:Uncharacterized protein n=1 Tax=Phialemonium thermophilum TaxID=223376 RepID=A0ABR3V2Q0_9PEZI